MSTPPSSPVSQEHDVPIIRSPEPKRRWLSPIDDTIVYDELFHVRAECNTHDWEWYPSMIRSWVQQEQVPSPYFAATTSTLQTLPPLPYPFEHTLAAFVSIMDREIRNMLDDAGEITGLLERERQANEKIEKLTAEIMSGRGRGGRGNINMTTALTALINERVAEVVAASQAPQHVAAEGAVGLLRWFEKVESVFAMCNCPQANQVKYASGTLEGPALTWWNSQVQILGLDMANTLPWEEFKTKLREEYCPRDEIQKLEGEFWNLKIEGSEIELYTTRSHEYAVMLPHMVTPTYKRIERYIDGLVPQIQSMVTSSNPTTIQQAIRLAHRLTDRAVTQGTLPPRGTASKATDSNKRKFDGNTNTKSFQCNPPQQQQRRFEPTKTFNQSTSSSQNQGNYVGKYPKCNKCVFHHNGACDKHRCQRCGKIGHATKDCRGELQPKQPFQQQGSTRGCYECGKEGHFRKYCPQLKKGGNGNGNGNDNGNNQGNNGNNNGNGAKGSFISKNLSNLLKETPTLLETKYTIEIEDGQIIETTHILKGCKLRLAGHKLDIDLMSVTLGSFDIIIGMDCLSKNQVEIICRDKIVRLPIPSGEVIYVQG
ncbi:hypothetical protein L1987_13059 [Smallanthus sonchifolius]|uniref:Uncharacterized protein n=1 Tax=Smallanthus sonchifolius TaxID=185202 RepID=A0ACB9JFH6_9ASTR|nr:hypothetical protein L1987_13059 [Smallanthus sonchifolius]